MNITKRSVGKPPNYYHKIEDRFLIDRHKYTKLVIPPTKDNFIGSDKKEPIVCNEFGCKTHLTPEQQLYGTTCINHQTKEKIDVNKFLSYPIKRTG